MTSKGYSTTEEEILTEIRKKRHERPKTSACVVKPKKRRRKHDSLGSKTDYSLPQPRSNPNCSSQKPEEKEPLGEMSKKPDY